MASINCATIAIENEIAVTQKLKTIIEEGESVPVRTDQKSLPIWFDPEKFKRGQEYFKRNYFAMFVGKLSGLLLVLSLPSALKVLILTGKSSEPAKAFRRYMDTISHMKDWYYGDVSNIDSEFYKSLVRVRGLHCAAARNAVSSGNGTISQKDMALTQFGFIGICLLKKNYLGMKGNDEDVEGIVHFWRTIGYLMGIDDKYNLCSGSTDEVLAVCEKIRIEIFKRSMQKPPDDFAKMSKALLLGMRPVVPFLHPDASLEFTRRMVDVKSEAALPGLYARCILSWQIFVHTVLLTVWYLAVVFKPFLNFLLKLSVFLNSNYPFLASLTLGNDIYPEIKDKHTVRNNNNNNNNTIRNNCSVVEIY